MTLQKPFGTTLFCDDIRKEYGGKMSLMGIYGSVMKLPIQPTPDSPVILPKLGLLITYQRILDEPRSPHVRIEIYLPGESRSRGDHSHSFMTKFEAISPETIAAQPNLPIRSLIPITLSPVVIKELGRIAVHIRTEGFDNVPFGRLQLVLDESAEAAQTDEST